MSKFQCQRFNVKGLITSRNSKGRQYNDKKKKDKRTNNNLQNTTPKSKDRTLRTPLKHGVHRNGKRSLLHILNPSYYSCLRSSEGQMICDIVFIDMLFVKIYIIKKIAQCCMFFFFSKDGGIPHTLDIIYRHKYDFDNKLVRHN